MKTLALLSLSFLTAPLVAAPIALTEVGLQVDVTKESKLTGTGKLVLKDVLPSTEKATTTSGAAAPVTTDMRCEVPLLVTAKKGKAALEKSLLGTDGVIPPDDSKLTSYHMGLGFFSVKEKKAAPLTDASFDDVYGEYSAVKDVVIDGAAPVNRLVVVNKKGVAFAMPLKNPLKGAVTLSVVPVDKLSENVLCQNVAKNGFSIRKVAVK